MLNRRSPLLHFLLLGTLLFALRFSWPDDERESEPRDRRIVISASRVDELSRSFARRTGRSPDREDLEAIIARDVDEEILYREAIARGLREQDGGVQTRLVQKMLFLDDDTSSEDTRALLERARDLGLDRGDVVVRRILVQKMKLLASALEEGQRPTTEEIAHEYELIRKDLREPDRMSFIHVFFNSDRRGSKALEDARAVRARIHSQALAPGAATDLADPFPLGTRFERQSLRDLERRFGGTFGEEAFASPLREWSQPIASAYGLHLLWIDSLEPGETPALEAVREVIRHRLERQIRDRNLEDLLEDLRTRYEVVIAQNAEPTSS